MMRKHAIALTIASLTGIVLAGVLTPTRADVLRYRAFVYPDRTNPDRVLQVSDFRVNETVHAEHGVTYLWLHGPDGNFHLPFSSIGQVEVVKYLGLVDGDTASLEVRVTTTSEEVLTGNMEIRNMRGATFGVPWYYYLYARPDHGANFWRFVLGNETREATVAAALPPSAAPAVAIVTVPIVPPAPPGVPPEPPRSAAGAGLSGMSDDELAARFGSMTLAELNALMPLADPFFDFDKSNLRPDALASLDKDVAWLNRFPSVRVQIQGQADPRGTHEYNLRLGQRRSTAVRNYLVRQGIAANRLTAISLNASQLYCTESTEECWQINRRTHFVITAK